MSEKDTADNEPYQYESVEVDDITMQDKIQHLVGYVAGLESSTNRLVNHQVRNESTLELVSLARIIERFQRIKKRNLGDELSALGEPVWMILIQLVIATEDGQSVSVAELARRLSLPETTTVRYLNILESKGFIFQSLYQGGQSDSQLHLTKQGHSKMRETLLALTAT